MTGRKNRDPCNIHIFIHIFLFQKPSYSYVYNCQLLNESFAKLLLLNTKARTYQDNYVDGYVVGEVADVKQEAGLIISYKVFTMHQYLD